MSDERKPGQLPGDLPVPSGAEGQHGGGGVPGGPVMKAFAMSREPGAVGVVWKANGTAECAADCTMTVIVLKPDGNPVGSLANCPGGNPYEWWMLVGAIPPEQYGWYTAYAVDSQQRPSNQQQFLPVN